MILDVHPDTIAPIPVQLKGNEMQEVISLNCPNCGASVDTLQKKCRYCKSPIVISSFNSVYSMPIPLVNKYANTYKNALTVSPDNSEIQSSIAMCFLKLKLYDKAIENFDKAIIDNIDNSELFFYLAVALLRGQKAFMTPIDDIKRALELVNAAIMIEPRGVYYYFSAYIKYDYYERKFLNISPNYLDDFQTARDSNVSFADAQTLFELLGKPVPETLQL